MAKKLTLDTNCIIALEKNEPSAASLRQLIELANAGKINLAILGISASENQKEARQGRHFSEFQTRISSVGLGNLEILKPVSFCDITYFDWCIFPTEQDTSLLNEVWTRLFPNIQHDWPQFANAEGVDAQDLSSKIFKKWLNAHCDAQIAWASIKYGYDALVTLNTYDFQRNLAALKSLGLNEVWTPEEAINHV